ncbi:MAG: T9SS type A sorting domain-containing protein [Ignavibacteriae bacterium]|nr:T9SS C-terminal target domain-containing protein [Ignavibacteriota bacterium]NOG99936.1 T9SS type A sorting domain-containing protein [Ignavibacteriota bacterium]
MFREGKVFNLFFLIIILFLFSIHNLTHAQNPPLFSEVMQTQMTGVYSSSAAWGDYDNDGDLDIVFTGQAAQPITKIYRNDGENIFTEMDNILLYGVQGGCVEWGDYDNDNDLDILLTGTRGTDKITKIYSNEGNDTFTEMTEFVLENVGSSSVDWGDYDNDGDLDILLGGSGDSATRITKIYRNDKADGFNELLNIDITQVKHCSVNWGDYDNDGDLDVIISGGNNDEAQVGISKVFRNDGDDVFTEQVSISLMGFTFSSAALGDYDCDGDLDFLLSGNDTFGNPSSRIYTNNGNNTFTELTTNILIGITSGSATWVDYDNDGDLDIFLTGLATNGISKFYKNQNNTFQEDYSLYYITPVDESSGDWADYDNDGDLDLLLIGEDDFNNRFTKIYRNNSVLPNTLPSVPTNLTANVSSSAVTLSWGKSTDAETPQDGLSYNLAIGSQPGAVDIVSPMSDRNTGFRKIVKIGNTNLNNSWTIKKLSPGLYYWSVQAIDNNFAGSEFAEESSFEIEDGIVPVELVSFTASLIKNSVHLEWETASELNNLGFEIERKNLGWEKIGFVKGEGNSTNPKNYKFSDENLIGHKIFYRLKQLDFDGSFEYSNITEVVLTPQKFRLFQNHPNPFNPTTKINYAIPSSVALSEVGLSHVKLTIYDILGNEIALLIDEQKSPGNYSVDFDASMLSSGMYIYRIQAGGFIDTKKMILLK